MTFSAPCSVYLRIFVNGLCFVSSLSKSDSRACRRRSGELLLPRGLEGVAASSAADCVNEPRPGSLCTDASDEPGEPIEFIEGFDVSESPPLVGSADSGVVADGVRKMPLVDPEMVAECCVKSAGRLSLLEPAEYVAEGDLGRKNVLGFRKLSPPPRLFFFSESVGDAVLATSSPNSESVVGKLLWVEDGFRCVGLDGVPLDGFRNTLSR